MFHVICRWHVAADAVAELDSGNEVHVSLMLFFLLSTLLQKQHVSPYDPEED